MTKALAKKNRNGSPDWKKVAMIGGGVLVGGLVIAWIASKYDDEPKANYGIKTESQCSNYTITDPLRLQTLLRDAVNKASKKNTADPFVITSAFLTKKGLGCTSYPTTPRNPGEANLFYVVFKMVTDIMVTEKKLSQAQKSTFDAMAATWAISHGMVPDDAVIMDEEPVTPDDGSYPQS